MSDYSYYIVHESPPRPAPVRPDVDPVLVRSGDRLDRGDRRDVERARGGPASVGGPPRRRRPPVDRPHVRRGLPVRVRDGATLVNEPKRIQRKRTKGGGCPRVRCTWDGRASGGTQAALERVRALADDWTQAAAIEAFPASFRLHMSLRADELRDALNNQEVSR